ncbi:Cupin domain-containing protein [Singulisphaera sp. GP187]|uniref:cupin domain-containing protein n=1 Tax=Singulisphaera sp. GP187 TaxID=1882752 RepID=UPI00092A35B7|nr:cupin domain-containing protein [Singulisphaera sp. GP187]SIO65907.1 Cupin domain-containing protein [Singulisphaera sp. GP187]
MSVHPASRIDEQAADSRVSEAVKRVGVGAAGISRGPYAVFPRSLHEDGPSRVIPLDLGRRLDLPVSATARLALSTSFIRLRPREPVATHANATAEFYYVLRGHGRSRADDRATEWQRGDCFVLPSGRTAVHAASDDSALFWVHDEPWLSESSANAPRPRFESTANRAERRNVAPTDEASDPGAKPANGVTILPADRARDRSWVKSATLRSRFDVQPGGGHSRPLELTRSTTLHLILDCQPGCSTLIGKRLDDRGRIMDPACVDWEPGSLIVNPPATWIVHRNDSQSEAHLMPLEIQDLRTSLGALARDSGLAAALSPFRFESSPGRGGT